MEKFSISEVIEMAVQIERLGYRFYLDMAYRFKTNETLNKLFTTLAEKEQRHEKAFEELKGIVGNREPQDWQEAQLYFRAIMESEFFLGDKKSLPSMDDIKNVSDAVNKAMGFEKETLLFFIGLREEIREKDVIDGIITEERSHIVWLSRFRAGLEG